MTKFIAIETRRGNRKVAWIQDEFAIPFTMGEGDAFDIDVYCNAHRSGE